MAAVTATGPPTSDRAFALGLSLIIEGITASLNVPRPSSPGR
jgi:hypothetical protein